jgi:serine/threonine-protein kinase RsbW
MEPAYAALMDGQPQITITFPASPEFLRLARLTSADAGSRAGFDYEDIDDLRIAVSELCTLISGFLGGDITLKFQFDQGVVDVAGRAAPGALVENEFSRMIVDAVVDDLELQSEGGTSAFRCTKRSSTPA